MTFGTIEKFKEAVIRFALAQGYDLTFSVSDSKRRRVGAVCRSGCKFKLFASWEEMRATYVVKTVINHHVYIRDMHKNRQLKSSWVANYYLMKFKDNPHWSGKDIINTVKVDFGIVLDKWVAYRVRHAAHKLFHGSMKDHYCKLGSVKFNKCLSPPKLKEEEADLQAEGEGEDWAEAEGELLREAEKERG
ncbi:hypothetical protein Cgig2_027974 [Carnegiea gigantea]|uniref:Transposase MuDR plant domain-containing protein n=1 Tax=Carnegiea gigantea TaxID=171969 RepID=A0A9Q1JUY4_9CARY|nr:hypothetical protein Cgig2_027974 [Carnegiea gigantea]